MRFIFALFLTFSAHASEVEPLKNLEKCLDKSWAYYEMVDENENLYGQPYYQKKLENDGRCQAIDSQIEKRSKTKVHCELKSGFYKCVLAPKK